MPTQVNSYQTAEYGKFLQLSQNSQFPPISVVRLSYPDTTNAFPSNSAVSPLSSVEVYPKYAVLAHIVNTDDIKISLSANEITVNLGELEELTERQNTILESLTSQIYDISTYVDDLEKNTFDTASACDDSYRQLLEIDSKLKELSTFNYDVTVTNPITATIPKSEILSVQYADSPNIDAFGRLRTSMPETLFDSKTLHNKQSLFWSQVTNGAGSDINFTGDNIDASVTLSSANIGGYAIRQTNQRFNYQSGKSQLAIFTGVMEPVSNAIKRYGLFQSLTAAPYEPNCGLYFETQTDSPSSIAVVQRNDGFLVSSVSARRENWNLDKLDGNGPSGKTLNLSAANIFMMDYEWLGVGRVRFGFVIDGLVIYCHEINNAGNVSGSYLRTPNLPLRAEIRQISGGTASMKVICSSVMSEGGSDYTGVVRSVDTGTTPFAITTQYNRRAMLGLRLQHDKLDSVNELLNTEIANIPQGNSTDAFYRYEIVLNPTLGGSSITWQNVDSASNFQYAVAPNNTVTVTGGTVISVGYSNRNGKIDLTGQRFQKFLKLGCSIDGKRDEIWLVFTPIDGKSGNQFASFTFIESD
jgi:hypothetical protein